MFSSEICQISKKTFFTEHQRMTASEKIFYETIIVIN